MIAAIVVLAIAFAGYWFGVRPKLAAQAARIASLESSLTVVQSDVDQLGAAEKWIADVRAALKVGSIK